MAWFVGLVEWQFHHKIGPQAITSHYVRSSESGTITLPTLGANTSVKTAAALHFAAGILYTQFSLPCAPIKK